MLLEMSVPRSRLHRLISRGSQIAAADKYGQNRRISWRFGVATSVPLCVRIAALHLASKRTGGVELLSSPCPRVGLDSWVSSCTQHAGLRIDDDRGAGRQGPRWCDTQLVTARNEFLLRRFGDAILHRHGARNHCVRKRRRWKAASGPPWSFDCLLDVHAKIDHVDQCLHGAQARWPHLEPTSNSRHGS